MLPELDPARRARGIKWKRGSNKKLAVALDMGKRTTMSKTYFEGTSKFVSMICFLFWDENNCFWQVRKLITLIRCVDQYPPCFLFLFLRETTSCPVSQCLASCCSPQVFTNLPLSSLLIYPTDVFASPEQVFVAFHCSDSSQPRLHPEPPVAYPPTLT